MQSLKESFVSVIIPCRNEAERIESCLRSILDQQPPDGGFEIVVADGVSTDGTRDILSQMAKDHPQIRLVNNPARIISTGLNTAIRAARGEVIIRMDVHLFFAPDYIKQCVTVLNETGADNVGGPAQTYAETYLEKAISTASSCPIGGSPALGQEDEGWLDTISSGCWKKNIFDRIGYFDEDLVRHQDNEHNLRILRAGGKIWRSWRIRSWHRARGSLWSFISHCMQHGYWKVLVFQKHRPSTAYQHWALGLFLGALFLLVALGLVWLPAFSAVLVMTGLYVLTVLAVSVRASFPMKWALLPVMPLVFFSYHFAYSYGLMRGFLDFVLFQNAPHKKFMQRNREQVAKRSKFSVSLTSRPESLICASHLE